MDISKIGMLFRNHGKLKKTVVWQADVFTLSAPGTDYRAPVGFVLDPHAPRILVSRVFPPGRSDASCLAAAVKEAMFVSGLTPDEVVLRSKNSKALDVLARKAGFMIGLCDELRELEAVRKDMVEYLRVAFAAMGAPLN